VGGKASVNYMLRIISFPSSKFVYISTRRVYFTGFGRKGTSSGYLHTLFRSTSIRFAATPTLADILH
jgi:hypothetical protein